MKKVLSWILICAMLACFLCGVVGAEETTEETPKEAPRPVGTEQLANLEHVPEKSTNIAKGLPCPDEFSQYSYSYDSLTEEQRTELARYLHYGLSVVGVSALERTIHGAVDGIWAAGNTGDKLQNGSKAKGAFAYIGTNKTYNYLGKSGEDDSIYRLIMTCNFGKLATLEALGFVGGGGNNMPQAADVYVSKDGENWTLIGYWDRTAMRMNGEDMPTVDASELGMDATEQVYSSGKIILFDLKNTEAQFLRICAISNAGKGKPADVNDYTTYSNTYEEKSSWRELLVYGTLLDKENTVTASEETVTTEEGTPTSDEPTTDQGRIPDIPVRTTEPKTTTEAPTTAAPGTTQTPDGTAAESNTTKSAAESKGCASSAGISCVAVLALLGAAILGKRH